jgi:hypothetical protein
MTGPEMEQYARIGAIVAGIIFGGWALSSVIWVWTKKQIYAYGGSALSVVGVILMGLSIYKTVDVKAAPDGIGLKLSEMETLLKQQTASQAETQKKLAQIPTEFGAKLTALDKVVKDQGAIQLAQFNELKASTSLVQRANATVDNDYWVYPSPTTGTSNPFITKYIAANKSKLPAGTVMLPYDFDFAYPVVPAKPSSEVASKQVRTAIEKGSNPKELSGAYITLGDALKRESKITEALDAYSAGIQALKEELKTPKAPEPEKKAN